MSDADQNLIEYLAEHDCSCPQCGYNLRGATCYQCSECGLEFEDYGIEKLITLRDGTVNERWAIGIAQFILICWAVVVSISLILLAKSLQALNAQLPVLPGATSQATTWGWEDFFTVLVIVALILFGVGLFMILQREKRFIITRNRQKQSFRIGSVISVLPYVIIILGGLPLMLIVHMITAAFLD